MMPRFIDCKVMKPRIKVVTCQYPPLVMVSNGQKFGEFDRVKVGIKVFPESFDGFE